MLLVASVSFKPTIEHEYASVVFTLDKLRHPLFQGVPFELVGPQIRFEIGEAEYREKRVQLLEGKSIMTVKHNGSISRNQVIFTHVAERVRAGMTVESEIYVGFLISMFSAMRDIYLVKFRDNYHAQPFDQSTDRCIRRESGRICRLLPKCISSVVRPR